MAAFSSPPNIRLLIFKIVPIPRWGRTRTRRQPMKDTVIRNLHRGMGDLCRLLVFVAVFVGAAQSSFGADEERGNPLVERTGRPVSQSGAARGSRCDSTEHRRGGGSLRTSGRKANSIQEPLVMPALKASRNSCRTPLAGAASRIRLNPHRLCLHLLAGCVSFGRRLGILAWRRLPTMLALIGCAVG